MPPETPATGETGLDSTAAMDEVLAAIDAICVDTFDSPPGSIGAGTDLRTIPGADSVRLVHAHMSLEKHYGVSLPDSVVLFTHCAGDLAAAVLRSSGSQRGTGR